MKLVITGPTGMVGAEAVRQALADPQVDSIVAVSRRPLDLQAPRLKSVVLEDFMRFSSIADELAGADACLFCLGVSQNDVKDDAEYERVTHDYAVLAATTLKAVNPKITFCFLSGQGADSSEKSRILFSRIKGKTENSLARLGLGRVFSFRPGYIHPVQPRAQVRIAESVLTPVFPFLQRHFPKLATNSVELSMAMIEVAKHGHLKQILENIDIRDIGARISR
jgi:uncharacterized protein YbjT (DUF2867 family)